MNNLPDHAFVLAAGFGTRLRPYTDGRPKPLVEINGRTLLDRALDHLELGGVSRVTVNTHYMADMLEEHVRRRDHGPAVTISREETALDTAGGVKNALETMGGQPFYMINGDALWENGPGGPALLRLAQNWNPAKMDILMLLQPVKNMTLTKGVGDYRLETDDSPILCPDQDGDYMFAGIRIVKPEIFNDLPPGPSRFLPLMNTAQEQRTLAALVHDGDWHHVSTPEELESVDEYYKVHEGRG